MSLYDTEDGIVVTEPNELDVDIEDSTEEGTRGVSGPIVNNLGGTSETPSNFVTEGAKPELSPNPDGFGFTKQTIVTELPVTGERNTLYLLSQTNNGVFVGYLLYKWDEVKGEFHQFGATPDLSLLDGERARPVREENAPKETPEQVFNGLVVFNKEPYIKGLPLQEYIDKTGGVTEAELQAGLNTRVRKIAAPTSTTLTDEQFNIIKDGVFIEGTFLSIPNPVLYPCYEDSGNYYGIAIGGSLIGRYSINGTTKVIQLSGEGSRSLQLRSIAAINGKTYPSYPANDVKKYYICDNGTLKWADINLADIVDAEGHKRFDEGDIIPETITGITYKYSKWSLSGTHLLIVVAGDLAIDADIATGTKICEINLPDWIKDKIYAMYGNYVEYKSISPRGTSSVVAWSQLLEKTATNKIQIVCGAVQNTTQVKGFRISFDLLIDTDAPSA